MKSFLFLIFSLGSVVAFGQSAKKLNKQLWAELALEEQKQDSTYALFKQSRKEYDSVRSAIMEKVMVLSREESITNRLAEDFAEVRRQLQQLGTNPSFLVDDITFANSGIPNCKELTAPLKDAFDKDLKFHKVSNSFYYDKDSKPKELNPVLIKKLEEYDDHSKMNAVVQDRTVRNTKQLKALSPSLDSVSHVYELMSNELRSKGGKLRDKLDELRGNYISKGPDGFPEAYRRVFYDAFPPPETETREESMKYDPIKGMELDEVGPELAEPDSPIYEHVDELATFPGGYPVMKEFISKNLRYPAKFKDASLEGRVVLQFIVSEKGRISDIEVIRPFPDCKECDLEAIRVTKLMPDWTPARVNGKTVKSYGKLIVWFKM